MTEAAYKSKTEKLTEVTGDLAHLPITIITVGVVAVAAGLIILVWPGATLALIALVVGIFLLVHGAFRLVSAVASDERTRGGRAMLALLGVVSILVGLLVLRHPLQTLAALTVLLGLYWVLSGVLETVRAIGSHGMPGRGWAIAGGLVSLAAGVVVLAYTAASLVVLVWLLGLQLAIWGVLAIATGIHVQRTLRAGPETIASPRTAPEEQPTATDRHRTGPA